MRPLIYCVALALTACNSSNPLFGLDPTEGTGGATTADATSDGATAADTSAAPTSQGPTTGEGPTTASPSEPVTSGTTDQLDTTGVDPNSTSNETNDSDIADSSTGEMFCELHKDPDFDDILRQAGQPYDQCFNSVSYFHGKLQAGGGELRFNTTGTQCDGEENLGVLSLGTGYSLTVPLESQCAKLYLYRDGKGPVCNIAQFFIVQADPSLAIAIGAFSPAQPVMNPPPSLVTPEPELLPCCPAESQACCEQGMFGDYALNVEGTLVLPGATDQILVDGKPALLANIQNWETGECLNKELVGRRDWAGIRL